MFDRIQVGTLAELFQDINRDVLIQSDVVPMWFWAIIMLEGESVYQSAVLSSVELILLSI